MKISLDERAAEHLQQMLKSDMLDYFKIGRQACERWNRENEPWDFKKLLSWTNGMLTTLEVNIELELEHARLLGVAARSPRAAATGEARARLRVVTGSPTPVGVD